MSKLTEILETLASGWRSWTHDQLDGTSFIADELKEIDKTVAEAEQAINAYIAENYISKVEYAAQLSALDQEIMSLNAKLKRAKL